MAVKINPESGELYITDTIEELARRSGVAIYIPQGEYLDGGNVKSWLKANLKVAMDNEEMKGVIAEHVGLEPVCPICKSPN